MTKFASYLRLLRVHQWIKNLFIFAPILFGFKFNDLSAIINAFWAFLGFSFIASTVYIINDWMDREADKLHPKKKNRPIAAGKVGSKEAITLSIILLISGFSIYILLINNIAATLILLFYFLLNIGYCLKLKQISIVDISIVALGFVLRLFIGGVVTGIVLSHWLIIMTFLIALLLVIGKRRDDVVIYDNTGQLMRKNIANYNLDFLNAAIVIIVSIITFSYIMYTISPEVITRNGEYLYLTSFFVILGLFRYLQAIFVEKKGGSPTELVFKDRFLQILILFWLSSFVLCSLLK